MIIDRIYEWARSQPNKAAIIQNASTINYAAYARAIESAGKYLARQQLPQATTAGLLISNLSNCWIVSIAMRAIGLNTIAVPSVAQAQQLQVRDLSCFVVMERELGARDLAMPESTTARLIVVPTAIFADIHQGDPPAPLNMNSLYGGHILYTSGTTGTNKKIFMSSDLEDERNARRAEILSIDAGTISNGLGGYKQPVATWHKGACIVFGQSQNWAGNLFKFGVTRVYLVPHQIKALFASRPAPSVGDSKPGDCVISVSSGFLPFE
jgi:hypothetical protein